MEIDGIGRNGKYIDVYSKFNILKSLKNRQDYCQKHVNLSVPKSYYCERSKQTSKTFNSHYQYCKMCLLASNNKGQSVLSRDI